MAIVPESFSETINSTAGTSCVITKPSGTVDGDLLTVTIDRSMNSPGAITPPAGWTLVDVQTHATSVSQVAYWRVASSEGASYTFTWTGNAKNVGRMVRWSGAASVAAASDLAPYATASATHLSPSVTTPADNCVVLRTGSFQSNGSLTLSTGPGGTQVGTSAQTSGGGSNFSLAYYSTQATAGSTGTASWTVSASVRAVAGTIVIVPAAGGDPVSGNLEAAAATKSAVAIQATAGGYSQAVTSTAHTRAGQPISATPGASQAALVAGATQWAAQSLGAAPGATTGALGTGEHARTAQGASVTPGAATAATAPAGHLRGAQSLGATPGAHQEALTPAAMERVAMGLSYSLGAASVVLTPAGLERMALALGVTTATVIQLEVAVAVRTPTTVGVVAGEASAILTAAAIERLAQSIGATTGQAHSLVVAVSLRTAQGVVGTPGAVTEQLTQAYQQRASLDAGVVPGPVSQDTVHATSTRGAGELTFQAGPAFQAVTAATVQRVANLVASIPGAASVILTPAAQERLAYLISAIQGLTVSLTPAMATRLALDIGTDVGAISQALTVSTATRLALDITFSAGLTIKLEPAQAQRLAQVAGVTPGQFQASVTAASRLLQAHALGVDVGPVIAAATAAGAERTARELNVFIGLLLQELYGYHRMTPGERGLAMDVPHKGKIMSVSRIKTERPLFRRAQYPGTSTTWTMDWSKRMTEEGTTVSASTWSCVSPDLVIELDQLNANIATVRVSGPVGVYELLNAADFANGDDDVATIVLTITATGDTVR